MAKSKLCANSEIMNFIRQGIEKKRILLCEVERDILPLLQQFLPTAELCVFSPAEQLACRQTGELPVLSGQFDCILIGRMLEEVPHPEDFVYRICSFLQEAGNLVFVLGNMQNWRIWQAMIGKSWYRAQTGIFDEDMRHRFTLSDACALCERCHFGWAQVDSVLDKAPKDFLRVLRSHSFEIRENEFDVGLWVFSVQRYDERTTWLRQQYTAEIRHAISRLLCRIENDIERAGNIEQLYMLCVQYEIPFAYLKAFVENTAFEPGKVLQALSEAGMEAEING